MDLTDITKAIKLGSIRITDHADEEAAADRVTLDDIFESVFNGEIIEEYLNDKPYPSCLIFGRTPKGKPVHSVWAYNIENGWTVLITVYEPDPARWIDWKKRRKQK